MAQGYTSYEVEMVDTTGANPQAYLVAYVARPGYSGILDAIMSGYRRRLGILSLLADGDYRLAREAHGSRAGWRVGPWHIRLTGRTMRECKGTGPALPYVGDLAPAEA